MPSRFVFGLLAAAAAIQGARAQVVETSDKEDTTGMPRVIFFRPKAIVNHGYPVAIYCDVTKVAELRNNTYFELALSPGVHVCAADIVTTHHTLGNTENVYKMKELSLDVKLGPKQWVSVSFKHDGWTKNIYLLEPVNPTAAAKEVEQKHAQPIKPEDQTIRAISRTLAGPGK